MNRIEQKMALLIEKNEKALMTYIIAGLPGIEETKELVKAQEKAGTDVIGLKIPFSDPVADGPVVQKASYQSICLGTTVKKVFQMTKELRSEGVFVPIVFLLYYNTILHYGIKEFVGKCKESGVDAVIVPDLPLEEQEELQNALKESEHTILIQMISKVSKERIPSILEHAKGFVYCTSSMGTIGQAKTVDIKEISKIPVLAEFEEHNMGQIKIIKEAVDGVIVGSDFIQLLEENDYCIETAKEYCKSLKQIL